MIPESHRTTAGSVRYVALVTLLALLGPSCGDGGESASGPTLRLTREEYTDRVHAMWLGESVANWTGLVTEMMRVEAPFFTDDDWGTKQGNSQINGTGVIDFVFQDPWGGDDDTDIEYIYLDAMARNGRARLSAAEIREAWNAHIEPGEFIWVSNNEAHTLMLADAYALPPSTSLFAANDQSLMIDAQLTTELFGACAPGRPVAALELADLPIRVTASAHAAHAAQFFVALYSLALAAPEALPLRDRILWLVRSARRLIPDTSKTADVIDFVVAQYQDSQDLDDWELARDAVALRYQEQAADHGFQYLSFYESSVNLATGVLALLFGEGDFKRTVQIGTLSGWDSDNGTATMGGLLGLLSGTAGIREAFPDVELSESYDIHRTRIGFDLPDGTDAFPAMAARMIPLVEAEIAAAGGIVDEASGAWSIPLPDLEALVAADNPLSVIDASSASNHLRRSGVTPEVTLTGVDASGVTDNGAPAHIVDGVETDFSGTDRHLPARGLVALLTGEPPEPFSYVAPLADGAAEVEVAVNWGTPVELAGVRFVEGRHLLEPVDERLDGGWFEGLEVAVRADGEWIPIATPPATGSPSSEVSFEIVEWILEEPRPATGVRLRGRPGGTGQYGTIAELEGIRTGN